MTLHLIALPHTRVTAEFCGCAYTAKTLKFTKMMRHHDVTLYAAEGSTSEHTAETVTVLSESERIAIFGDDDPGRLPDWPTDVQTALFNARAGLALSDRYEAGDLVLLTGGVTHDSIREHVPAARYIEPGVGYEGIITDYCAFESHAHRHTVYAQKGIIDGRWFDRVIPNYFDPLDFPHVNEGGGDYLLFVGRLVSRKGPHIAGQIASAYGMPLVVAGAGGTTADEGIRCGDGELIEGDVTYVGPVTVEERAALMAGARALLVPTTYLEPFGGVAVEAMLCGTPAITSDWGAFTETVPAEFRFHTLQQALDCIDMGVDHEALRTYALERYSLAAVAPMFAEWFDALASLEVEDGWYLRRQEAHT